MTLLYHQLYENDLAAATEECGGYRDVRMSWSYTDPHVDETTVVILIAPSATFTESANGKDTTYLLKVALFMKAAEEEKGGKMEENVLKEGTARREVRSALFELQAPMNAAVVRGTSGVVFLSTRQFLFHATEGEKSLDRFVFILGERAWERQCGAVKPLDSVEPINNVLAGVTGDSKLHLLLVTRISPPSGSSPVSEKDYADLLLVVSKEERVLKGGKVKQRVTTLTKGHLLSSGAHATPVKPCHTFIVALVRCTMQALPVVTPEWELLHLFVDRAVPFYKCVSGVQTWPLADAKNDDNVIHPNQCIWCYVRHSSAGGVEEEQKDSRSCETERARGVVVALVPQSSCALTVVCGGFDEKNHSYRLGLANSQETGNNGGLQHSVEDDDNPEEALWSLSEDTHTVQMVLLGTPVELLQGTERLGAETTTSRRAGCHAVEVKSLVNGNIRGGWMRKAGLVTVLRFVVDFLDDGLSYIRNGPNVAEEGRQGLYIVASTLWTKNRHGRFPLPRSVCWNGLAPLPIGKAATSSVLFSENDEELRNDRINILKPCIGNEDATAWYHTLPTSIASSFPTYTRSGVLCCFVSVNTLLKKTRLTYVLKTTPVIRASGGQKQFHISELLYTLPQIQNDADENNDVEANEKNNKLAVCLARASAMQDVKISEGTLHAANLLHNCLVDQISSEVVMYAAWRSVAMGKHGTVAQSVLDRVAQFNEVIATQEVRVLANNLRHFLLTFLIELDWITHADNQLLCGVVLLMLGAVDIQKVSSSPCYETSLNDGRPLVPLLTSIERCSLHLLLWCSEMWQPLAASLFAWINQKSTNLGDGMETLLEDIIQSWREMVVAGVTGNSNFDVILKTLRASQDCVKFHSTITALFGGNVPICEVALLTGVKEDEIGDDPFVVLLQLFLEVTLDCDNAAATAPVSVADIDELVTLTLRRRLHLDSVLLALVEFLHGWNFGLLENWPLVNVYGGLPVVYLLFRITTATASRNVVLSASHHVVLNAARVLHWLCSDTATRTAEVLSALCTAKVSLSALCFVENLGQRRHSHYATMLRNSSSTSSNSYSTTSCMSSGGNNASRALHHLLVSPTASILKSALAVPEKSGPTEGFSNGAFALTLWTFVLEGDEAAAFNLNLLRQFYELFHDRRNSKRAHSAFSVTFFLDFIQPVFLVVLPRIFDAVRNQHETIRCALAGTVATTLGPPLDESEAVKGVWLDSLHVVKQLLLLYFEDSLEVHCLLLLFSAFQDSSNTLLDRFKADGGSTSGGAGVEDIHFALSLEELYFVSLQILSNEPARFLVAVEVMRRSLRPYLLHQLDYAIKRVKGVSSSPSSSLVTDTKESPVDAGEVLYFDSKTYLNDVADNLAQVMSSFEETAPLYAHALLLLFLDESIALVESAEGDKNRRRVSAAVQSEMLQCARQAAHSCWAKLHRQEKRLLVRVLSHRLSLSGQEGTLWNAYNESEAHHQVIKDMNRIRESLQLRSLDAALLSAVRGCMHSTCLVKQGPMSVDGHDDRERGLFVSSSTLKLLIKEETYVRRHLQLCLMQGYDEFISCDVFYRALGVLYLALREEQRRRVFVVFACDQKDIILSFALTFLAVIRGTCQQGVRVLRQNVMEEFQRRFRFLIRQERESRTAAEAVCSVERDILYNHSTQQRAMFDAEATLRFRCTEEEEMQRDSMYELFAREEMEAQQLYEARIEEETWRQEEALWEEELNQSDKVGKKTNEGEEEERLSDDKEADKPKWKAVNDLLQWQSRRLASMEEKAQPLLRQPPPPSQQQEQEQEQEEQKSDISSPSPMSTQPLEKKGSMMPGDTFSPASALAPLLQMGITSAGSDGDSGYHTLLESSDKLFSAFSRLQRQIVSTVAPPPPTTGKHNGSTAAVSVFSHRQQQREEHREEAHNALSSETLSAARPLPLVTMKDDGWDDSFEDVSLLSSHAHPEDGEGKVERESVNETFKVCDDNVKRLRLRKLSAANKHCVSKKRRLGDVVCLDNVIELTTSSEHTQQQNKDEFQQKTMDDVALGAMEGDKKRSPHLDDMEKEGSTSVFLQENEPALFSRKHSINTEDKTTTTGNSADVMGVGKDVKVRLYINTEQALVLQSDEEKTRFATCCEERLTRVFLFRRFVLEA